jgi:hypothetical protein
LVLYRTCLKENEVGGPLFKPKSEEGKTAEDKLALDKIADRVLSLERVLKTFIENTDKRLKTVEQTLAQKQVATQASPTPAPPIGLTMPTPPTPPRPVAAVQPPTLSLAPKPISEAPSISEGIVQKFVAGIENVTKAAEKLTQISTALEGYIKDLTDAQAANTALLAKVEERLDAVGKALAELKGRPLGTIKESEEEISPIKRVLDKVHKDLEKRIADAIQEKSKTIVKEVVEMYKSGSSQEG